MSSRWKAVVKAHRRVGLLVRARFGAFAFGVWLHQTFDSLAWLLLSVGVSPALVGHVRHVPEERLAVVEARWSVLDHIPQGGMINL